MPCVVHCHCSRDEETKECNTPTNTNKTVQTRYHMEQKQFPRNSETVQHVQSNKKNIDATKQNEELWIIIAHVLFVLLYSF